jgi:Zn-dependent M16 (insulinase) family peptidase
MEFAKKEAADEEARLKELKKRLTPEQIAQIHEKSQHLTLRQQKPQGRDLCTSLISYTSNIHFLINKSHRLLLKNDIL